ncbi:MAG TPA: glycosyltransferase [Actinomycetes bacterium]|jgi:glycosyltransferase involved in cell wall biosynthesis|nr:glycosyltransferase [Actinomycetes bacterium]
MRAGAPGASRSGQGAPARILLWHVHGAWTTSFVQGRHQYLVPVLPGRGPVGRGRARTYAWPDSAVEVTPEQSARAEVDVVVLQRPGELDGLAAHWLGGRRPGRDVPAVYLEHNAPQGRIGELRHPAADRPDLTVVHVTHFNDLFWDCGSTPTRVIEHGVVDPGRRYTGELARAAVVINEAARRGRVTGTDLLPRLAAAVPVDLFGIGAEQVGPPVRAVDDLPQARLHGEMARRRVYLHPVRWTSLGLSLLEAMHLGMPVVALATTEVVEAVPPEAGVVSTNVDALAAGLAAFAADPERARLAGQTARAAALARYGLDRFLAAWDRLLEEVRG